MKDSIPTGKSHTRNGSNSSAAPSKEKKSTTVDSLTANLKQTSISTPRLDLGGKTLKQLLLEPISERTPAAEQTHEKEAHSAQQVTSPAGPADQVADTAQSQPKVIGLPEYIADNITYEGGEFVLNIGSPSHNGGQPMSLTQEELDLAISNVTLASKLSDCDAALLHSETTADGERIAHMMIRRIPASAEELVELRIAVIGNVDAGKSTMLGVLTKGGLDDGRGKARVNLFRHKHEVESGRTSSVGMEIMGFDSHGTPVTNSNGSEPGRKMTWEEVCAKSSKVISFIVSITCSGNRGGSHGLTSAPYHLPFTTRTLPATSDTSRPPSLA